MKSTLVLSLLALAAIFFSTASVEAGYRNYSSWWNGSNGNQYGLVANGNHRALYSSCNPSQAFFSGQKRGCSYHGSIHENGRCYQVSGPISNNSTRVTLHSNCGRCWTFNFCHR